VPITKEAASDRQRQLLSQFLPLSHARCYLATARRILSHHPLHVERANMLRALGTDLSSPEHQRAGLQDGTETECCCPRVMQYSGARRTYQFLLSQLEGSQLSRPSGILVFSVRRPRLH
jgi:hypothetical protein